VGFGNILTAEYFRVPLTTIRQPKYRLGMAAVDAMMNLLKGQRVETKRLSAELIERRALRRRKPVRMQNRRSGFRQKAG